MGWLVIKNLRVQKRYYLLFAALFVYQLSQLYQPLKLGWPFSPYDMFKNPMKMSGGVYYRVELIDDAGERMLAAPGNCLPVEFFIANAIFDDVYGYGTDEEQKEKLAKLIIDTLNNHPWKPFQGIYAPILPHAGRKFVGLDFKYFRYDFQKFSENQDFEITEFIPAYQYRMERS